MGPHGGGQQEEASGIPFRHLRFGGRHGDP